MVQFPRVMINDNGIQKQAKPAMSLSPKPESMKVKHSLSSKIEKEKGGQFSPLKFKKSISKTELISANTYANAVAEFDLEGGQMQSYDIGINDAQANQDFF